MKNETLHPNYIYRTVYRPAGNGPVSRMGYEQLLLENYYLNDKVKILQDTYTQINAYAMEKAAAGEDIMDDLQSLYSKDGEQNEITRLIRNVNEKYNITVVIVDSTNDETYPSFWDGRL